MVSADVTCGGAHPSSARQPREGDEGVPDLRWALRTMISMVLFSWASSGAVSAREAHGVMGSNRALSALRLLLACISCWRAARGHAVVSSV